MVKLYRIVNKKFLLYLIVVVFCIHTPGKIFCQNTIIKGFVDALATYNKDKLSFSFGEQDLFITSELSDRISFLGESVFKFDPFSKTEFSVSVERIVLKYNFLGNHNILIGKHHTPLNYWNDTYHHGRLFFPTIGRPLLFAANIIPLHTTGISLQGHDLGKLKFGYDLMIGNGLGASEIMDNNQNKSITVAVQIKPVERLRIGGSYYHDMISKGSTVHDKMIDWRVDQNLFTVSVAYFGKKFEILAESTLGINHTDTTGHRRTFASYCYTGYRVTEKIIPYVRFDNLDYQQGEIYFTKNNTTAFVAGIRYQINFLAVVKFEYQYQHLQIGGGNNMLTAQFAIGF